MQENRKKMLIVAAAIGCLVVAGAITYLTRTSSHGIDSIDSNEKMLVKCGNPSCNAQYETNKRGYYEFLQKNMSPMSPVIPPLKCEKCGKTSVYRAIVCENCKMTFFYGEVKNDFKDRCPKCKFSKTEDMRKKAKQ
jgi:hypothetical protein